MAERLKYAVDSLTLSYSIIFFSQSRLLGLFVIAATMVIPSHGVFGIMGALFSNASAYVVGLDRQMIRKGLYGFNGILVGLGLGFFYDMSLQLIFILFLISVAVVFVTALLNQLVGVYLGLPSLSMPFTLVTWLVILASLGFGYLHPSYGRSVLLRMSLERLPEWANIFFISFGALLFQLNTVSGIIIALGIFIYSRIAFIAMTAGFVFALWMHRFLGIDGSLIGDKYLGFNYMLTALAIGAVFSVPGPGSMLLGLLTTALSVIILLAAYMLFPPYLSPLALPFNMAVMLVLYGLRARVYPSLGVILAADTSLAPEENLSRHRKNLLQWRRWGLAISLPFHGKWQVTQGFDGKPTHQESWNLAYDFQAVDSQGRIYRNEGTRLDDYYAYGLPVIAAATGKVTAVNEGVDDNQIGAINALNNWGNYVIIEHAAGFYSCTAHFKKGSIRVKPGQEVGKGEVLALCGNSGRSPYPHIHLQFQYLPQLGAPTIYFEFSNLLLLEKSGWVFLPRGIIREKSVVQNPPVREDCQRFFPYVMNTVWPFSLKDAGMPGKLSIEEWRLDADFYGNTFLVSSPQETRLFFQLSEGVLTVQKAEGSRQTGLFLLGAALLELPCLEGNMEAQWTTSEDVDYLVNPLLTRLLDVLALVGISLRQRIGHRVTTAADEIEIVTERRLFLNIPFGAIPLKGLPPAAITLGRDRGVTSVRIGERQLTAIS